MKVSKIHWLLSGGGGATHYGVNSEYEGIISHWALDNEHALDYFEGQNHGVTYSNNLWGAGKTGGALSLASGSNRYIEIGVVDGLSFTDGANDLPFSLSFWIYPTSNATSKTLVSKRGNSPAAEYQIVRGTDGKIGVLLFSEGSTSVYLYGISDGAATINQFSFITISYDGSGLISGLSVTINNVEQTLTDSSVGTYVKMDASANLKVYIGAHSASQTSSVCYIGLIEDVTFFNKVIDSDQISSLYNDGDGIPLTYTPDNTRSYYDVMLVILASRGNYQVATTISSTARYLYWSDDGGVTWKNKYDWGIQYSGATPLQAKNITMARLFDDGTLIFATSNKIYRSTNKLVTITDISATNVFESDKTTAFTYHTPASATYPGMYFANVDHDSIYYETDGDDFFVWVNYGQTELGAAPTIVWCTRDKGVTIYPVYEYGQNNIIRDDGTNNGGATGTLLGDSGNSLVCRHGHSCVRDPDTYDWYSSSGDNDNNDEIHFLKHTYDVDLDSWSTVEVATDLPDESKWKQISALILDGELYFGSDATAATGQGERDIFKCTLANIGVSATKICAAGTVDTVSNIYANPNGKIIATFGPNADFSGKVLIGDNFGATFELVEFTDLIGRGMHRMQPADSRGYVRIRSGGTNGVGWRTVFVKVE